MKIKPVCRLCDVRVTGMIYGKERRYADDVSAVQSHCAAIVLVRKLDSNVLLQRLKRSSMRKPDATRVMGR